MFLSIVVPTYNNASYLPGCLQSIIDQPFQDWEAIVVVDGSPDESARIAIDFARQDARIRVIDKEQNEGTHLARKSGVEASKGDYLLLLDADDELHPNALEGIFSILSARPAEMLHYGINVIDAGVDVGERSSFEAYINEPADDMTGDELLEAIFSQAGGYRQDWRVTQRVYSSELIKRAYQAMTDDRLGRAQDGYESFVIACLANEQITANDVVALDYYYGRGLNGSALLSCESFERGAWGFQKCIDAIAHFAAESERPAVKDAFAGAKAKLLQLLMNDWLYRVPGQEKMAAAQRLTDIIGPSETATELMRLARDEAYRVWDEGGSLEENPHITEWFDFARRVAGDGCFQSSFRAFAVAARGHIADLENRARLQRYDDQRVRIFVAAHKNVDLFESEVLQPVQAGSACAGARFSHMLHDDQGDNISTLNPMYCELTAQYWAWKNVDADYYGFCHYRRYFDFSETEHDENVYGEVMDECIDAASQAKYCLDDASIRAAVRGFDVVTTRTQDIRRYMGDAATNRAQYDAAEKLFVEDLDRVMDIVVKRHPEYAQDVKAFLGGHTARFCNMFIMRREVFFEYCEWLFPILEEFTQATDMAKYTKEGLRTPGHLSERLLNVFLLHHERMGAGWKAKELQCVHFNQPDLHYAPEIALFNGDTRPVIPVVFAADNNYVPMLTTTMLSMMKNASNEYCYEVTVLQKDISYENRKLMIDFFTVSFDNISLQFCDVTRLVAQHSLTTNNPHISIETYYRFLVQELMPLYGKVLYLDSDLIVKGDVSELFGVQLGDNLLAAVRDVDFLGNVNMQDGERAEYTRTTLGMSDPYAYFQAGVLVLNTQAMRELHPLEKWLEFASDDRFIYNDQDVLNAHCEGRVVYLPYEWNVMTDCANRIARVFSHAPSAVFDAFNASRSHEKVVHYAGFEKPWKMSACDRFELYWSYARETPFYERMLAMLCSEGAQHAWVSPIDDHECAVSEDSPLRRIVDPIAPLGTARREVLKSIGRAVQGKR